MADNRINIVISAKDQASGPLKDVSTQIDRTGDASRRSGGLLDGFRGALGGMTLALGAVTAGAGALATTFGFGFNSSVEQAETKLMAFMKDGERVARTLEWVKKEAAATQFSFTDMADAAANLTPVANSSGVALEDLVKQAEILAAINPTEGLTGATFSLREALSGDWVSIIDRFNLPRKRINELKAEGVPAMEIITRTLKEMGIEYDLVAKQGQTVSARWDQIIDKLTMTAGVAAKPIFDRVSSELERLGNFDFTALGNSLAGVVSGAIKFVDEIIPKIQELGMQVWDYLGPKFESLGETIQADFLPLLQRLWNEVLVPLGEALGTVFVGALGAVLDMLTLLLPPLTDFANWMVTNKEVVAALAIGILGIKAALNISDAISGFKAAFADGATSAITSIDGVEKKQGGLKSLVGNKTVMGAIAVEGAIADIMLVMQAVQSVIGAIHVMNELSAAQASERVSHDAASAQIRWLMANGTPEQKARARESARRIGMAGPAYALGTSYAAGGMTLVGEHGPELVNLPQGSQVKSAWQTRSEGVSGPQAGSSTVNNIYGNIMLGDSTAVDRFFDRLDRSGQLAARGLAP